MTADSSSGSGQHAHQQAHAAFPAMPPPTLNADQVPNTPRALRALIESTPDPRFIIPVLQAVAAGTNQQGSKKAVQMRNGETVLQSSGWDLYSIEDSDTATYTAALVYILSARLQSDVKARRDKNLSTLVMRLCVVGDPAQIAACIERIGGLAWGLCEDAMSDKALLPEALMVLKTLIDRTAHREVFTAAYPAFLQLCLASGSLHEGMPVALSRFTEVARGTRYQDILAFYHHAGTIAAAAGHFKRAAELFAFAVSMPAQTVSAVHIACAKRAILCEILSSGKVISFPKYTPSAVSRQTERTAADYNKFAKAYENREWAIVYKALENPVFRFDCNEGLVLRVIESIPRRQILQLREVFSKISIAQLASRLELLGPSKDQDCQDIVVDMISRGDIRAQLTLGPDAITTIVAFADPEEPIDPSTTFVELERNRIAINRLEQAMTAANQEMGVNEAYIKKQADLINSGPRRSKPILNGADINRALENYDEDEGPASFWVRPNRVGADQGDMGY